MHDAGTRKSARVVFLNTGRGLRLDAELLKNALENDDWQVTLAPRRQRKAVEKRLIVRWEAFKVKRSPRVRTILDVFQVGLGRLLRQRVDLQIHLEDISLGYMGASPTNWLIPNQEWVYPHNLRHFSRLSRILCKTHEAYTLFEQTHPAVTFLGFSNPRLDQAPTPFPRSADRWRRFLHVAGKSSRKGTQTLVEAWQRNARWPALNIVTDHPERLGEVPANIRLWTNISESDLARLRRECGIVLAPSEVEGFGHVLLEGMLDCAVVISTDAPPMNELVRPDRGFLVGCQSAGKARLGRLYKTSPEAIERAITELLATPDEALQHKAERAHEWVCENHLDFRRRFNILCGEITTRTRGSSLPAAPPTQMASSGENEKH